MDLQTLLERSPDSTLVDVLRLSARAQPDPARDRALAEAAGRLTNWDDLPAAADAHGLAPLVHVHLTRAGVSVPPDVRQRLFGLAARHRQANAAAFRVLTEILGAFETERIPVLVLKGAALAHILYPSADLRPLSDLDLLVSPADAARAQQALGGLGFTAPAVPSRRLASHHHLPVATKQVGDHVIQVEIHRDALSRDVIGSLAIDGTYERRQPFPIGGRVAYAFGHADMLYQLSRHIAERAPLLRLIWAADIISYADRFREEIDWDKLRRRYPFVLSALSLLHLLVPLPETLLAHVTPARPGMQGVGVAGRPLTDSMRWGRPVREIARDLFAPSEWWLRLHYGVGARESVGSYRWLIHPLHVAHWFAVRAGAYTWWWVRTR